MRNTSYMKTHLVEITLKSRSPETGKKDQSGLVITPIF